MKQALVSSPILAFPTEEGRFIIDADASLAGMGSVLSQVQDGVEKVISYYSKTFSKPEGQYCVPRKEFLAVVSSIKNFHHYLYGRHFLVRSEHGTLRWLINFKNPEGQIARWLEVLSTYDFEIQHRAGRIHSNADALSRRPCLPTSCTYCSRAENNNENKKVAKNDIEKDMCSEDHSVRLIMKQSVLKNSGLSNDENVDVLRPSQEAESEVHLYRSSFSDNRFRQEGAMEAGLRSSREEHKTEEVTSREEPISALQDISGSAEKTNSSREELNNGKECVSYEKPNCWKRNIRDQIEYKHEHREDEGSSKNPVKLANVETSNIPVNVVARNMAKIMAK